MKIENQTILTAREKLFCGWYAQTGNGREAASRAGYQVRPERAAMRLLARQEIRDEVENRAKQAGFWREAVAGLRRLAFGSGADALRLFDQAEAKNADSLDLFNVSEMKFGKNGTVEIKFFDRQKALEKLAELSKPEEETETSFYAALERSGAIVSTALEEDGHGR